MIGSSLMPYAVAAVVTLLSYQALKYAWRAEGAATAKQEIVQASQKKGEDANAKNERERKRAAAPGAAERLLKDRDACRDCQ